jgi:hypothetical protein
MKKISLLKLGNLQKAYKKHNKQLALYSHAIKEYRAFSMQEKLIKEE